MYFVPVVVGSIPIADKALFTYLKKLDDARTVVTKYCLYVKKLARTVSYIVGGLWLYMYFSYLTTSELVN